MIQTWINRLFVPSMTLFAGLMIGFFAYKTEPHMIGDRLVEHKSMRSSETHATIGAVRYYREEAPETTETTRVVEEPDGTIITDTVVVSKGGVKTGKVETKTEIVYKDREVVVFKDREIVKTLPSAPVSEWRVNAMVGTQATDPTNIQIGGAIGYRPFAHSRLGLLRNIEVGAAVIVPKNNPSHASVFGTVGFTF